MDADAKVSGRVVGTCDLGHKKFAYLPGKPAPVRGDGPILTECKDGTTSLGGDCRK